MEEICSSVCSREQYIYTELGNCLDAENKRENDPMISTRMMRKRVASLAERVGEHWRTNMDLSWKMLHLGKSQWPSSSQSMMEKVTLKHRRHILGSQDGMS